MGRILGPAYEGYGVQTLLLGLLRERRRSR
jgi:hypothetical protein